MDVLVEGRFEVVERTADDFGNILAAELVKETVVRSCGSHRVYEQWLVVGVKSSQGKN